MKKKQRIFRESFVDIEIIREPDEELVEHIASTVLGTPGGLRYRHKHVGEKIRKLGNVFFMILRVRTRLLGSVGLLKRSCIDAGNPLVAWYVRYFSIKAPLRSKKHPGGRSTTQRKQDPGLLKGVSSKYFENPFRLEDPDDEQKRKTFIYAYIEGENERSISFSEQMGLQKARTFKTLVFSRFRSRKHKGCRLLKKEEIPEIKNKLSDYYSAYTMFTLENIAFEKDYWVYEREGQIVAGVKVHRGSWELADIKGFTGFLLKRLLPSLPFFRSFVQPGDFRFNALEGLFHTEGEESALNPLLSQIARIHKTPLFLMWADPESGMYRRLKEKVRPGLAGRLFHPVAGEVRVRFIGFDDREKDAFLKKPVYLSSFDMI